MTSAPVETSRRAVAGASTSRAPRRRAAEGVDWSASRATPAVADPATEAVSSRVFSPARRVLPRAMLVLALTLVAVGYAVALGNAGLVTGTVVVAVAGLGAVCGLSVRGCRDRRVPLHRVLGEGLRGLGRTLWY